LNDKKRIVIIGATSSIAEHCARLWITDQAVDLTLVGRDAERTERVARDLRVRSPGSEIRAITGEFLNPAGIDATIAAATRQGSPDIVLIAHGVLPEQNACENDLAACRSALDVNAISPALYAEGFAKLFAVRGKGTLAIIGSVAGDRGRKSNYVYGAAKGLLDRYAQGLQHRFAGTAVHVVLIKPGPTATPMTAHMQGGKLASVESVAKTIVSGIEANKTTIYAPGKWRLIMLIIRHMPAFVFNHLNI
jgi:decaprenylphospho-beta-D-erythro-pentofuranosid-2-ulose 2-reductase